MQPKFGQSGRFNKKRNLRLVNKGSLLDLTPWQNPSVVFIKGRRLNRETLDSFEEKARNRKNLIAPTDRYLENLIIEK